MYQHNGNFLKVKHLHIPNILYLDEATSALDEDPEKIYIQK